LREPANEQKASEGKDITMTETVDNRRLEAYGRLKAFNEAYGRLKEAVHIAGYTFERACQELEWLLVDDRWKVCANKGFTNVNDFIRSIQLDDLRPVAEARKRIAKRIKELQPQVSNRAIACALGVKHTTIDRDIVGTKVPTEGKLSNENKEANEGSGTNVPATAGEFSGERAAKLVLRRETASTDRLEKVADDEQRVLRLAPQPGKFRTIILDPAWNYDWLSIAGRAKPGYAMQTHEQLLALDVKAWADTGAGCHLYLWTTNNFMGRACELVAHWGFQHRTLLTWIKPPPFGLGSYYRNSTEHVLFATLGETTTRPAASGISTHFEAPCGEHSEKPERFYDIVRAASYPPYGEGNQRKARDDFTSLFCPVTEAEAGDVAAE
jgi:N6-adenosine-specific RNA methylase IME4